MNQLEQFIKEIAGSRQIIYSYYERTVSAWNVQDIERQGYITIVTPLTATTANVSTPFVFARPVNRVTLQNNSGVPINFAFDEAAGLHSLLLPPQTFVYWQKKVKIVQLFATVAVNVNQDVANNLVVLGAL